MEQRFALAEVLHVERVGDAQGEAVADVAHLFVIGLRDDVGQGGDEDGVETLKRRSLSTAPRSGRRDARTRRHGCG